MDSRDLVTLRRILEDQATIDQLGRPEVDESGEHARQKCAQAALTLLPYADEQAIFDALFRLAFMKRSGFGRPLDASDVA